MLQTWSAKLGAIMSESRRSKRIPTDPLERAEENALAFRDMARAEARRQPEHESGDADTTARHEALAPQIVIHNHPSHADIEPEPTKPRSWITLAVGAAVTAILAWLANRFGPKP